MANTTQGNAFLVLLPKPVPPDLIGAQVASYSNHVEHISSFHSWCFIFFKQSDRSYCSTICPYRLSWIKTTYLLCRGGKCVMFWVGGLTNNKQGDLWHHTRQAKPKLRHLIQLFVNDKSILQDRRLRKIRHVVNDSCCNTYPHTWLWLTAKWPRNVDHLINRWKSITRNPRSFRQCPTPITLSLGPRGFQNNTS